MIVADPKNSLIGDANVFLCKTLVIKFLNFVVESVNFFSIFSSALKPFITLNPVSVSSINDKKLPVSCCANNEFAFNFFPTAEIINPDTGNKMKTNKVSFALMANIDISVRMIVKGSRTTVSNEVRKETSTS